MDLSYGEKYEAFRQEIRAFLKQRGEKTPPGQLGAGGEVGVAKAIDIIRPVLEVMEAQVNVRKIVIESEEQTCQ